MKIHLLFACAAAALISSPVYADWIASGQFNYTDRLYDLTGFTGTSVRPVREADVQVYDTTTLQVLASGATNGTGNFSISVPDGATRNVGVRVLSSNGQVASLNFAVVDDKNGDAIYSYHDAATDRASHPPAENVDFGTMTMPTAIGDVANTDWSSQVFNTYDMGVLLADWIANADGARPGMFYTILWNPTNGRTGSFYTPSTNRLSLSDDDAYDDANILHEIGHYIEDEYGFSRNTGGTHFLSDNDQDPRLAYSEGFATFVSSATLDFGGRPRPDIYADLNSFAATGGFAYSFETAIAGGVANEQAVNAALYDLIDTPATLDATPGVDDDTVSSLQAGVWSVVERMRIVQPAATSLEDFWDIWFSLGLGNAAGLTSAFAAHGIDFAADAQEPNGTPATATVLPITTTYQKNSFYRSGAVAGGDEDWFRFTATSGTYYAIEVNGANGSILGRPDPEMWLFDPNLSTVLAYSDDPFDSTLNTNQSNTAQDMLETVPSILWRAPASGTYYIYTRHSSQRRNLLGRYGTYNIRVRSLTVPTPTITSVSEQRMLQGQAYQVLVTGTNFSRDAIVTTNEPNVAVTNTRWLATSALVVTLTPSPAVADGAYSLTVTNPTGSPATFASAFEVNSAAQPPIVISEVELNADAVEVRNIGTATATLTGWTLQGRTNGTAAIYTFPAFTLAAGATVVVREGSGTSTASDLFAAGAVNFPWNPDQLGDLSLVDDGGRSVDYIRWVTSPVGQHLAVIGTGGAWMAPQFQAASGTFTIARSESTALYRTHYGLSASASTMPVGAANRANNTDPWEENDQPRCAPVFTSPLSITGVRISSRPTGTDSDWYAFAVKPGDGIRFDALFTHASGNLNMELYAPGEESTPLLSATGTVNNERIELTSAQSTTTGSGLYRLRIFGAAGAVNTYSLEVGPLNAPPTLSLPGATVAYTENDAPLILDAAATVTDTDSTDFNGGTLTIDFTADGANEDRLGVATAGAITVAGQNISFSSALIGTFTGGLGGANPLVITFNSSGATPAAVEAVARSITYGNISEAPSTLPRTVRFVLADGDGGVAPPVTKSISVLAVNDPPQASNLSASENYTEDTPRSLIDIVITDPDSSSVTATLILSNPAAGSLSTATSGTVTSSYAPLTGTWTAAGPIANVNTLLAGLIFSPAANFAASFTVDTSVTDGVAAPVTGTKNFIGTPVNDPPTTTAPASVSLNEDTAHLFTGASLLTLADVDSTSLAVTLVVTKGTLSLGTVAGLAFTAGDGAADAMMTFSGSQAALNGALAMLTYQPGSDYNGSDSLTFTVNDGVAAPAGKSVALTVNAVADTVADSVSTNEDVAITFNVLTGAGGASTDNFEGSPQVTAVTQGAKGAVAFASDGAITYTPAENLTGADSFSYTVSAGGVTEIGAVSVTINPVNDSPTSSAPAVASIAEDTTLNFSGGNLLAVDDPDGGSLSVTLSSTNGTLTIGTPAGLNFTAGDGTSDPTMTFSGTITALNTGLATLSYHPTADFHGAAALTFTAADGTAAPVAKLVAFTINPVADVADDTVMVSEDIPLTFNVLLGTNGASADNFEGSPVITGVTQGNLGSVTFSADGTLIYSPGPEASGEDSFTYTVSSGGVDETGTVDITINPINDAPTGTAPLARVVEEDTALAFTGGNLLSVADVDTASLTVALTAANGTITLSTLTGLDFTDGDGTADATLTFSGTQSALNAALATVVFEPTPDFFGDTTLLFTITDSEAAPVVNTISVAVSAVADITADSVSTMEDNPLTFDAIAGTNGATPDTFEGSPSITAVTQGSHGSVTFAPGGVITYTPADNFNGADSFTYTVTSGGSSESASIEIGVSAVNDPPTSTAPAAVSITEDLTLSFLGTDSLSVADVDMGQISVTLSASPGVLTLGVQDGLSFSAGDGVANETMTFSGTPGALSAALAALSYNAPPDYHGSATLSFTTTDNEAPPVGRSVAITITPVDDLVSDVVTTIEDTVLVFNAIIGTAGANADNFEGVPELVGVTQGTQGSVTFEADGTITYSPGADLNGGDIFTYSVASGGVVETGTVTVTINPVNDAPTATNLAAPETYTEDAPLDLADVVVTDVDSGVLATLTLSVPAAGTLSTATAGAATSTFNPGTGIWQALGSVADVNALLAGVTFTPAPDFNSDFSILVNVTDGAASVGATKTVVGLPVNDVPALTKGSDIVVFEDAPTVSVPGWATAISPGPSNESSQALTFLVSANPASLFSTQPGVSADGRLSFRVAPDAEGTATVTVSLRDNGGTANGGDDTSDPQTFTISLSAVNDPPDFVMGPDLEVAQDAGPQSFAAWAAAITAGPGETGQALQFSVQVDKPELFAALPSITPDGRLIFSPAPNGNGIAVVTVSLRDDGGTANGGNDTSAARTFEIAVTTVAEELGTYFGLVQPAAGGPRENARTGTVQWKVSAGGVFTGKLKLAGQTVPMKGRVGNDGVARFGKLLTPTLAILRKNQTRLDLALKIEVARGTNTFSGTLAAGSFATIEGDRALYTARRTPVAPMENVPAPLLGTYTVLFPAFTPAAQGMNAQAFPQGDGFGKLTVTPGGVGKLSGTLADGTKISSSAPLAKSGRWPIYRAIGRTGSLIGFANFRDVPNATDVDAASLLWFHTAKSGAKLYTLGWPGGIFVGLGGARYTAPTRKAPGPVLPGLSLADADGNAELTLADGGLAAANAFALAIDANNRPTVITSPGPTFTLSAKTGQFKGTFIHPLTGRKATFNGTVLQKQQIGAGFFLGPSESGAATLVPDAQPGTP